MGFNIEDGTGKGYVAGVSSGNRLLASSISETIFQYSAEEGDAYFLGTPLVTLTTAGENAVFFLENNEDEKIIIENFFTTATTTTGGSPSMYGLNFYKNPTAMSVATSSAALNQNFGSSNTLDATLQYGASGSAFTGGTLAATLYVPVGQFNEIPANLVLEKGSSVGVSITPPAGNTSMPVQFGARSIVYRELY